MLNRMFTMQMSPTTDKSDIMCCIPIKSSYKGHERMEFEETSALCIYYRGSYEKKATAMRVLTEYAKENGIEASGYLRSVYLEGPPNRGTNTDNYITQIALPIKK